MSWCLGEDDLADAFDRIAPFTREEIERVYGDLIALLRREVRPGSPRVRD
jgi:hypothetical protein